MISYRKIMIREEYCLIPYANNSLMKDRNSLIKLIFCDKTNKNCRMSKCNVALKIRVKQLYSSRGVNSRSRRYQIYKNFWMILLTFQRRGLIHSVKSFYQSFKINNRGIPKQEISLKQNMKIKEDSSKTRSKYCKSS